MSAACVICAGASGRPLSGKRCTASSCKAAYSRRLREAKRARMDEGADSSQPTRAPSPASATTPGPEVSVAGFELWELRAVYGRRDYDPDLFTDYERRNGVNPDREKRRAVLAFAHYKEDSDDDGKSVHGCGSASRSCCRRSRAASSSFSITTCRTTQTRSGTARSSASRRRLERVGGRRLLERQRSAADFFAAELLLEHGAWSMEHGLCCMVHGLCLWMSGRSDMSSVQISGRICPDMSRHACETA